MGTAAFRAAAHHGVGGQHIARLRRNEWTFNDNERFEFVDSSSAFRVVDTKSSEVVLEGRVVGLDGVEITQGAFYSCAGDAIEITMEDWTRSILE